jgi:hypothetical protein
MIRVADTVRYGWHRGVWTDEAARRFPATVHAKASQVFAPYIVKRPHGGCQVLFPLAELDRLVDAVLALASEAKKG